MAVVRKKITSSSEHVPSMSMAEALALLERSGMLTPPVNVFALAEYLGIEVQQEVMDDDMSGYLEYRSGRWVAGINAYHHMNRKRFTLAHEIAHFLLHRNEKSRFDDELFTRRIGSKDKIEVEADTLAASVLMPEPAFKERIGAGVTAIGDLASYFGVSNQALRYRALGLGYRTTSE
jgi:Zn-dependent peptidase ImmA (M78 family)